MRDKLKDLLAQLRFHGMAAALERAEREATPASELLYRLLCEEAASRRQRSLAFRLDQAACAAALSAAGVCRKVGMSACLRTRWVH